MYDWTHDGSTTSKTQHPHIAPGQQLDKNSHYVSTTRGVSRLYAQGTACWPVGAQFGHSSLKTLKWPAAHLPTPYSSTHKLSLHSDAGIGDAGCRSPSYIYFWGKTRPKPRKGARLTRRGSNFFVVPLLFDNLLIHYT
jgi:hypothetical protein